MPQIRPLPTRDGETRNQREDRRPYRGIHEDFLTQFQGIPNPMRTRMGPMEQVSHNRRILVWDWPIRIFHASFGLAIAAAVAISLFADEHSTAFRWHMLSGLFALSLLTVRAVLGFAGSQNVRFNRLPIQPSALKRYALQVVRGESRTYGGHNPGTAIAAVLMFLLIPSLAITGLGIGGDDLGDLHGALAYLLMSIVGIHLAGIALHSWRYRENIAASMISGRTSGPKDVELPSARPLIGLATAALTVLLAWWLMAGFDPRTGIVHFPGTTGSLRLDESEQNDHSRASQKPHHQDDDHD